MAAQPAALCSEARAAASPPASAKAVARHPLLSVVVALLAATAVLAAAEWQTRASILALVGFLFLVVESDVRRLRIPNAVTLSALAIALAWQAAGAGLAGLSAALGGAGLALLVLGLPYLGGFLGAGDVKAGMALGALMGAANLAVVLVWTALLGGAAGLLWLLLAGALGELVQRWGRGLALSLATRRWTYFAPAPGTPAAQVLPFALVLAAGTAAALRWGPLWA